MISVYLKLYWSAFSNVRLQVKYLFSTRISNDHPLILTSFNAKTKGMIVSSRQYYHFLLLQNEAGNIKL